MKPKIRIVLVFFYLAVAYVINILQFVWVLSVDDTHRLANAATAKYILTAIAYVCLAILIWVEIEHLESYHLDRFSLLFLVVFGPFLRIKSYGSDNTIYSIIILVACVVIAFRLVRNWSKIPKTNLKWSNRGAFLFGLALILLIALGTLEPDLYSRADPSTYRPIFDVTSRIFYNLSAVSTIEEIMFRGFLWGYLLQLGWSEKKAMWTQAILFLLGHFTQIGLPITFFITIPIAIFIFSQVVWRTRQVFWAIIFHTINNVVVPVLLTVFFLHY